MHDEEEDGGDLRAAKGILLAVGLSLALWAVVIGAIVLARGCQDARSGSPGPAAASEAA